jgi:capsular polysaccharide biosynthesis protein
VVFDEPRSITPSAGFWDLVASSPDHGRFARDANGARFHDVPAGSVYTLPEGRVIGAAGWIVDRDDRLLSDLSPDYLRERYIASRHPLQNALRLPAVQSVAGTVAVLATLSADGYYGHWMMDLLPRAAMIARGGPRFEDLQGVYMPAPHHRYQWDALVRFGIRPEQIIDTDQVPHLRADQLIVPSWHANVFVASTWCCETLRALAPASAGSPKRGGQRVFISRSGTDHRRVVNEPELLRDVLGPRGFTSVRPEQMSADDQAELFAAADIVVTPLGSSMANLVHCRPGTQIVEIMNPRCVQPCTLAIASQGDLEYHVALADGVDDNEHEILEDLRVSPGILESAIDAALTLTRPAPPLT